MKSKKVLTILLSLAIMVTFMPTFAFAAEGDVVYGGHSFEGKAFSNLEKVSADTEGLKVLVEPTCDEEGVGQIACDIDLNGEACGFVRNVLIEEKGHSEGDRVRLTAGQIMEKMGWTASRIEAWYAANPSGKCEGYVTLCKDCGQPIYKRTSRSEYRLLSASSDFTRWVEGWTEHTEPTTGLTKCDTSFQCTVCGYEKAEDADHNATTTHFAPRTEEVYKHVTENEKRVTVTKNYCEECGFVEYSNPVAERWSGSQQAWVTSRIDLLDDFDHAKTTRVETAVATCMAQGAYADICDECGAVVTTGTVEKKPHTYETIIYDDGTYYWSGVFCVYCYEHGVDKDTCRKPGTTDKRIDFVPDDVISLTYTEITPANCEQGSFVRATYERNGLAVNVIMTDEDVKAEIAAGSIVEVAGKYYDTYTDGKGATQRVEVPYTKALGHEFGAIQTVAEATCTEAALEGKVCSKCNKVDHGTVQHVGKPLGHDITTITVAPTCGAEGYTYNTCGRCKLYVSKDGTTTYDADHFEAAKFDKVAPKVSLGTPCTFAWGDLDDDTEAEICTVCGAVKAGTETPKTDDAKKATQVEKAKPIIDAAANILAESDVYTADSVAAIEEAKANLNSAIAAGTSTDVKNMAAELQKAVDGAQLKAANTMTASGKTITAKKNATKTFKKSKAFSVKKAKGKVTFAKKSGKAKIVVAKNGKVTVKKGLKKGTYKVKVAVTAAGNGNYLPKTKVVTLKVKVK